MNDGAAGTISIEITEAQIVDAIREYALRRDPKLVDCGTVRVELDAKELPEVIKGATKPRYNHTAVVKGFYRLPGDLPEAKS